MPIGVELLVVQVDEAELFARLLWTAQRDPIAAVAAVHLLAVDQRAQVVTDSLVLTDDDAPASLRSEWRTPVGGTFALLIGDLEPDGDLLRVHLAVQDPDVDWAGSTLRPVRHLGYDFTVAVDGDPLPVVPAPRMLALVWPTAVDDGAELRGVVRDRAAAADDRLSDYDVATVRQRRAASDQLLEP